MHRLTIIVMVAIAAILATTAPAAARTSCSDRQFNNALLQSLKKHNRALDFAKKQRYGMALNPARKALAITKTSTQPCAYDMGLLRRYEIRLSVALVRWLEEKRDGNEDEADRYWSNVEFWSQEAYDLSLEM